VQVAFFVLVVFAVQFLVAPDAAVGAYQAFELRGGAAVGDL